MSADTESFKSADTDTDTDISAEISADTDTETDNFLSLDVMSVQKQVVHLTIVVSTIVLS